MNLGFLLFVFRLMLFALSIKKDESEEIVIFRSGAEVVLNSSMGMI